MDLGWIRRSIGLVHKQNQRNAESEVLCTNAASPHWALVVPLSGPHIVRCTDSWTYSSLMRITSRIKVVGPVTACCSAALFILTHLRSGINKLALGARINLRIGVVQFSPKIGQVEDNLARARELCRRIQPGTVDILCFPEMALTGYVFKNAASIRPYLEQPRTGVTSRFCAEIAKKLRCYVFAGYPEALSPDEPRTVSQSSGLNGTDGEECSTARSVEEVGANSAVLYGHDGEFIGGYRKTHLFMTDKTWAKAGTGFATFTLPPPIHTVCLGICMDLNAQIDDWRRPDGPYEIASHCLLNKANILILLDAWLDSGEDPEEPFDWSVLNFWAARLQPLWASDEENHPNDHDSKSEEPRANGVNESESKGKETIVVICNRCGEENGATFAGSSAIFSMLSGSGRPKLLDMMERREEGVRIWDIQV